jgi:hypothetical protein
MGVNTESMLIARARLCDQIDALADGFTQLSVAQLVRKVDDIRTIAQDFGFAPVAELARGFEKALGGSLSNMFIRPFIEAMRDAVRCERADQHVAEAFLASINQRLYG